MLAFDHRYSRVDNLSALVDLALGPHFELCGNPQEIDAAFALLARCKRDGVNWEHLRELFAEALALAEIGAAHRRREMAAAQAAFMPWLG